MIILKTALVSWYEVLLAVSTRVLFSKSQDSLGKKCFIAIDPIISRRRSNAHRHPLKIVL